MNYMGSLGKILTGCHNKKVRPFPGRIKRAVQVSEKSLNIILLVLMLPLLFAMSLQGCSEDKVPTPTSTSGKTTVMAEPAAYIGANMCAECHQVISNTWEESHHALAMKKAIQSTVLGDFSDTTFTHFGVTSTFSQRDGKFLVKTDGPDGELQEYEIQYTFGGTPLQQYLIEFPGGRYQALGIAWDSRPKEEGGQRWFHLYPDEKIPHDDELHWTGPNQNWNYMCAECHSTNLQKNYSLEKNQFETTWTDIDVACEACHGPGSHHVVWAKGEGAGSQTHPSTTKGLVFAFPAFNERSWKFTAGANTASQATNASSHTEIDACARCHSRRRTINDNYPHGKHLLETHLPSFLEQGLYYEDGQIQDEVYVYGSFLQSKMYHAGVTCGDCHEPHGLKLREAGNALCTRCHRSEHFDTQTHHFHKAGSTGGQCVNCHMPEKNYMVIDPRRDHSIRLPQPSLSIKLGTPNACNQCHETQTTQWAADVVKKWYGPPKHDRPHYGEMLAAGRGGESGADLALMKLAEEKSTPGIVRASALSLLRDYPSQKMVQALKVGMKDKDPLVRIGALRALDVLGPSQRYELGSPLINDPVRAVRIEAGRQLAAGPQSQLTSSQQAKLDKAVEEYVQSQLVNAERPSSHLNLGILHAERGKIPQAEEAYQTALRLDASFYPALVNLADLYRVQKRDKEGEPLLRQALNVASHDASVHHALGLLLVRTDQKAEAMPALKRAWEIQSDNPRYGYVYGIALNSAGKSNEAIVVLEETLQHHTNNPQILMILLTIHRDRGNQKDAAQYAKRLMALSPQDPGVRQLLQQLQPSEQD